MAPDPVGTNDDMEGPLRSAGLQQIWSSGNGAVHAPLLVLGDYVVHPADVDRVNFDDLPARALVGPPLASGPRFVGRGDDVERVLNALDSRGRVAIAAVTGLGGIGKTELAIEVATEFSKRGRVFWIDASTHANATLEFLSLGSLLDLPSRFDAATSLERIKAALAASGDYVLVFDNTPDPDAVRHLFPTLGRGRILITSVYPAWESFGAVIDLEPLSPSDSARLLFEEREESPTERAILLCNAFSGLPLGLAQARQYCENTGLSVDALAAMVASDTPSIWGLPLAERSARSIATVWALAVKAATDGSAATHGLLNSLAFGGTAGISYGRLHRGWEDLLRRLNVQRELTPADDALRRLRRYSLVQVRGDVVRMHPLLAHHVRRSTPDHAVNNVVSALLARAGRDLPVKPFKARMYPDAVRAAHDVLALAVQQRQPLALSRAGLRALRRATAFFRYWRLHEEASQLLDVTIRAGDASHATLLQSAHSLRLAGRHAEAAARFETLLGRVPSDVRRRRRPLVNVYTGYATVLSRESRWDEAEAWFEAALVEAEEVYGRPSTELAKVRGRYGAALRRVGRFADAQEILEAAVEELVALRHVDTVELALALGTMGRLLTESGNAERGLAVAGEAVRIRRRWVRPEDPPDHPHRMALANSLLGVAAAQAELGLSDACEATLDEANGIFGSALSDRTADLCQIALVRSRLAKAIGDEESTRAHAVAAKNLAAMNPAKFRDELHLASRLLQ